MHLVVKFCWINNAWIDQKYGQLLSILCKQALKMYQYGFSYNPSEVVLRYPAQ